MKEYDPFGAAAPPEDQDGGLDPGTGVEDAAMEADSDAGDADALARAALAAGGVVRGLRDPRPERLAAEIETESRAGVSAHTRKKCPD